jgi:hypothetical protein
MASPNKPDLNQPVDDDIYYDANSWPHAIQISQSMTKSTSMPIHRHMRRE